MDFLSFSDGSDGKDSACNAGGLGSIPGSGRPPGDGHGNPLQYSCLENPHGQRSLGGTVHGSQRVGHNWVTHTFTLDFLIDKWSANHKGFTSSFLTVVYLISVLYKKLLRWLSSHNNVINLKMVYFKTIIKNKYTLYIYLKSKLLMSLVL